MSNPFSDSSFVRNAVMTLYSQGTGHQEANSFLIEFETRDEAWQTLLQIISEDFLSEQGQIQNEVAYFAVNILYSKVCKHWKDLPINLRPELGNLILQIITAIATSQTTQYNNISTLLLNRLCMVLCAITIRSPVGGVRHIIETILVLGNSAAEPNSNLNSNLNSSLNSLKICLEILKTFKEEIDNGDVSRHCKIELYDELLKERNRVIKLIYSILSTYISTYSSIIQQLTQLNQQSCQQSQQNIEVSSSFLSNKTMLELELMIRGKLALETLKNWINISPHITLGDLYEYENGGLLMLCYQLLSGNYGTDVMITSSQVLQALLEGFDAEEKSELHIQTFIGLKSAIISMKPLLQATMDSVLNSQDNESNVEDIAHAMTIFISHMISKYMEWLCHVNAQQDDLEVINMLLMITGHPLRGLCLLTLDNWLELSDISPADRHVSLREDLHVKLLETLMQQCTYPPSFTGDWDDVGDVGVDEFVFKEIRGDASGVSGCGDVLASCYLQLQTQYFNFLAPKLSPSQGTNTLDWRLAEASLFCMTTISKEVVRYLNSSNNPNQLSERIIFLDLLFSLMMHLCSQGDSELHSHPMILRQGATLLGSFHSILRLEAEPIFMIGLENAKPAIQEAASLTAQSLSTNQNLAPPSLIPVLTYMNTALNCQISTSEAAKGIRNICAGNKEQVALLIAQTGGSLLNNCLISSFTIGEGTHNDRLLLVEGFTRVVASMVSEPTVMSKLGDINQSTAIHVAAGSAILTFCQPMLQILNKSLNQNNLHLPSSFLNNGNNDNSIISLGGDDIGMLCDSFDLLGTVIQFLDVPLTASTSTSTIPHIASSLLEVLLPLLRSIVTCPSSSISSNEKIISYALKCYGKLLLNVTPLVSQELSFLIDYIVSCFNQHYWSCCLDCVSTTIEALGDAEPVRLSFHELLKHLITATSSRLSTPGHEPPLEPALVQSFFHLTKQFLIFAPNAALYGVSNTTNSGGDDGLMAGLVSLSVACLSCVTERDSARAVLSFLSTLFSMMSGPRGRSTQSNCNATAVSQSVLPAIAAHGEQLLFGLMGALLGGAPSTLRDSLTECLASMLQTLTLSSSSSMVNNNNNEQSLSPSYPLGDQTKQWFINALSSLSSAKNLDASFKDRVLEACEVYTSPSSLALGSHHLGGGAGAGMHPGHRDKKPSLKRKLKIVLRDLASVCTGEANSDDCIYDLTDI